MQSENRDTYQEAPDKELESLLALGGFDIVI
jgi:hypothetical protein